VLKEHFPLVDTNYIPIEPTTFVSETREELHARAARFITGLIARLDAEQPEVEAVLLVTHAATKIALGRALLQDPEREIRTGTCSLDTYVRTRGSDHWEPERIGNTDFLSKGEEMHWGFGKLFFFFAISMRD
jgi:transcription factor C subunit 7